ncbi:hypothetical protein MN0502_32090 [Arthrobacter sp. MN05-02]|nr:hypothetical protein MN0502_32090 [Arthrobacter sp. MN05-02]
MKGLRDLANPRQPDSAGRDGAFMTPLNVLASHSLNVLVAKLLYQLERTVEVVVDSNASDRGERLDKEYSTLDKLLADFLLELRRDLKTGKLKQPLSFPQY